MRNSKLLQAGFGMLAAILCSSTSALNLNYSPLTLEQYLEIVKQNNSQISNASVDVQTANANKEAQSLYRFNPSVSYFRGGMQNQIPYPSYNTPASSTYGLAFNVEGRGKRAARESLAQSQIEANKAQFEATSANMQTLALGAYIDDLRLTLLVKSYQDALNKLSGFQGNPKAKDAERFLRQYKANFEKDVLFVSLSLLNYAGGALQEPPFPRGNLNYPVQNYNVEDLVLQGQNNRSEVLNLQASIDVADKNVTLVTKNRNVDVTPYVGQTRTPQYTYNNGLSYTGPVSGQSYTSPGALYTAQNSITAGITIPIPINNYLQNADIVSAANQKLKLEKQLQDLRSQIRVQVLQAFLQYEAARDALVESQQDYNAAIRSPGKNAIDTIMDRRDKEGALLDAQTNHLKALINLWRQSGNYSVPNL